MNIWSEAFASARRVVRARPEDKKNGPEGPVFPILSGGNLVTFALDTASGSRYCTTRTGHIPLYGRSTCSGNRVQDKSHQAGAAVTGSDRGNSTVSDGDTIDVVNRGAVVAGSDPCGNTIAGCVATDFGTEVLDAQGYGGLVGRQTGGCASYLGTLRVVCLLGNGDRGQDTDNRNYDHQFDQGKTRLLFLHLGFLVSKKA